jgi:hypothetical protein
MSDQLPTLLLVAIVVLIVAMALTAALAGWRGWLQLKHYEASQATEDRPRSTVAARIELADLRERVRKLEAIADGTDS